MNYDINYISIAPTGSNYICNPPVTDTDIDYVVLVEPGIFEVCIEELEDAGWELGGSRLPNEHMRSCFHSFKKGNINYIITDNPIFYEKFVKATEIAKDLNLLVKKDRVALFRMVMKEFYQ